MGVLGVAVPPVLEEGVKTVDLESAAVLEGSRRGRDYRERMSEGREEEEEEEGERILSEHYLVRIGLAVDDDSLAKEGSSEG